MFGALKNIGGILDQNKMGRVFILDRFSLRVKNEELPPVFTSVFRAKAILEKYDAIKALEQKKAEMLAKL